MSELNGLNGLNGSNIEKKELRKKMKTILSEYFSVNDVESISKKICSSFCSLEPFLEADVVLSFYTGRLEIDTRFLNETALASKKLALPKVVSDTQIEFFYLKKDFSMESQLVAGAFGIKEPSEDLEKLSLHDLAGKKVVVAVPGLAFTKEGKRCGHGKGYYDRFLSSLKKACPAAKFLGICLPCQIVDDLPTDIHDLPLDSVVCHFRESAE